MIRMGGGISGPRKASRVRIGGILFLGKPISIGLQKGSGLFL